MTETLKPDRDRFRVRQDDPEYQRQLQAEAAWWDKPSGFLCVPTEPAGSEYWNELLTGDPATFWFETIPRYGRFRRGCALGAALKQHERILEQNPDLHLTVYDISEESLAATERDAGALFPGRIAVQHTDLNFVELPPAGYDVIVTDSCLHHLLNLEHVAFQINRALAPGGYFFFRDYTGESKFQFSDEKKRVFEAALGEGRRRLPALRTWEAVWPDLEDWRFSPFEAVRAEETLDLLAQELEEVSIRQAGPLLPLVLLVRATGPLAHDVPTVDASLYRRLRFAIGRLRRRLLARADPRAQLVRELEPLDRVLSNAGLLRPTASFAVYRKKQGAPD